MIYKCRQCNGDSTTLHQIIRDNEMGDNYTFYPSYTSSSSSSLGAGNDEHLSIIEEENTIIVPDNGSLRECSDKIFRNRVKSYWIKCDDCNYKQTNNLPHIRFSLSF